MPPLDPAIVSALSLDPKTTQVAPHGTSGFTSTAKITSTSTSPPNTNLSAEPKTKSYFLKTSQNPTARLMFEGEHASLNAIHSVVPSLCPSSLAHGKLTEPEEAEGYFLVTQFLDFSSTSRSSLKGQKKGSGRRNGKKSLAAKLAELHTTPAPLPPEAEPDSKPLFGFPVPTACGSTIQTNTPFTSDWPRFYVDNRLLPITALGEERHGHDGQVRKLVERIIEVVVPRLLGAVREKDMRPVVVHGDLWSGNCGVAVVATEDSSAEEEAGDEEEEEEEVIFDPSACYAHSEYELGIMRMFGGFDQAFWREYHEICPRAEPVAEFEDRVGLYEL